MGGVPSVPTDKSRKLQVIAAGYSRTGQRFPSFFELHFQQPVSGDVLADPVVVIVEAFYQVLLANLALGFCCDAMSEAVEIRLT
jgi:hypothetical protein